MWCYLLALSYEFRFYETFRLLMVLNSREWCVNFAICNRGVLSQTLRSFVFS